VSETDNEIKVLLEDAWRILPRVFITTYIILLYKKRTCLDLFEALYNEIPYGHVKHITTNFNLMQHHKYSEVLDNMKPSERQTYVQMLIEHLKEEKEIVERERNR
jgi:hypothetical protein|tara:strand:+ start:305 stop:619 length:315 start_codon:yes stop_codon:yes gene_type:complete